MQGKRRERNRQAGMTPEALEAKLAPMQSAVKWALLGLLIEHPDHGYELARRFGEAYGSALSLSEPSYVYRALDSLERRGWIEVVPGQDTGRAHKTCYRSTGPGIASYQDHLIEQVMRLDDLARLHFRKLAVFTGAPERALQVIARLERISTADKDPFDARAGKPARRSEPTALAGYFHAQARRLARSAMLEWLHGARGEIEALAEEPAAEGGARCA
jgi:DNA-binding PadR family transcriptional regulator